MMNAYMVDKLLNFFSEKSHLIFSLSSLKFFKDHVLIKISF